MLPENVIGVREVAARTREPDRLQHLAPEPAHHEDDAAWFRTRFGVDVVERFAAPLRRHADAGLLTIEGSRIVLHRHGLLQIDRLLHDFFLDHHRHARYA